MFASDAAQIFARITDVASVLSDQQWRQRCGQISDVAQMHVATAKGKVATAKGKFMSFTADARLGAQVIRVQTGVDAKLQAVRDQKGVRNLLSKVGIGKGPAADGIPCEPPQGAASEVPDLLQQDPSMRGCIVNCNQEQAHLDDLLPALQDYQRHRQGLADAERRLATCLKEHGVRKPGKYGQALQASADMHLQASLRRLEAYENEEKHVTSVMRSQYPLASHDCKLAVQAYEESRKELRLLYEARERSSSTKQLVQESGANGVDGKVAPQVEAGFDKALAAATERFQATATAAGAKVAMLEAKHGLDHAVALAYHMKNVANEEKDISGMFGTVDETVAALEQAASRASLDITSTEHGAY